MIEAVAVDRLYAARHRVHIGDLPVEQPTKFELVITS
jgi:hypothetical protein